MTDKQRLAEDAIAEWQVETGYDESVTNGQSISWRYWVHQMPRLTPAQAARLMCGLDPDVYANLDSRPFKDDPRNNPTPRCNRAKSIERLAFAEGMNDATPAQWYAWAKRHRLNVDGGFTLEMQDLKLAPDTPAVTAPVVPAWSLITSLERTPGYRWPLYQFLKAAYVAGKPRPKAQEVLDAWKLNPPLGLKVIQSKKVDELEYQLNHGGGKKADLRAIQAAINGLIV